jgi:hypothetical protein
MWRARGLYSILMFLVMRRTDRHWKPRSSEGFSLDSPITRLRPMEKREMQSAAVGPNPPGCTTWFSFSPWRISVSLLLVPLRHIAVAFGFSVPRLPG